MQFTPTIEAATRILGVNARRADVMDAVHGLLASQDAICPIPDQVPDAPTVVCVDGAVISNQTDVVTWIAVAATNSDRTVTATNTAVTPVGSHGDAVRAAVMAAAELQVAVDTAAQTGQVWMDGSLATPLISIATSLPAVGSQAAAEFAAVLDDLGVVEAVAAYVELAVQGRVRALPKQDTSRSFVEQWSGHVDDTAGRWLQLQRDRALMGEVLSAGTCIAPRAAREVAAVEVSPVHVADLKGVQHALAEAMAPWRDTEPYAAYFLPRNLDRPVKYEFTVPAGLDPDQARQVGAQLAGQLDPLCRGPRMLEPLPQFIVDRHAKESVRYVNQMLATAVQRQLGGSYPEIVRGYRT